MERCKPTHIVRLLIGFIIHIIVHVLYVYAAWYLQRGYYHDKNVYGNLWCNARIVSNERVGHRVYVRDKLTMYRLLRISLWVTQHVYGIHSERYGNLYSVTTGNKIRNVYKTRYCTNVLT